METLKNIVKSIACVVLIASISLSIVYAFDGLLGGNGFAQVSKDLKQLIPEKKQTGIALAEVDNQTLKNNHALISQQEIREDIVDKQIGVHKDKFFAQMLNFYR